MVKWGPRGMQQLSEVRAGNLVILGFAGNSAPDHIDQFHAMPEFLQLFLDVIPSREAGEGSPDKRAGDSSLRSE